MNRTPSRWRAWSPVVYQVTGVLVMVSSEAALTGAFRIIAMLSGLVLWIFGLAHRRRLAAKVRTPNS